MKKLFFVGDVSLDEYYSSDRLPKLKEKIIVHPLESMMGGSVANAASVCASLGSKPEFFTALNSGYATQFLLNGLSNAGVGTEHIVFDDTLPDSKCIIILCNEEHTVLIPTLGIRRFEIKKETYEMLKEAELVYTNFCEIGPMVYDNMDSRAILKELKSQGVKVFCDADCGEISKRDEDLLPYIDTLMVNETGHCTFKERFGADYLERFFNTGVSQIIVTMAENGCEVFTKDGGVYSLPGIKVDVVDVTGAGDTFGASFAHAMSRSSNIKKCAMFANYMAARAVTGMGARYGCCSTEEIANFIDSHGGNSREFEAFFGD